MSNVVSFPRRALAARPFVPKRPPHLIAEEARKFKGDMDKVATADTPSIDHRGVRLESRYAKHHELEKLLDMLDLISDYDADLIESIYCDSKATQLYYVYVTPDITPSGFQHIKRVLRMVGSDIGGHNGIFIERSDGRQVLGDDGVEIDKFIEPDAQQRG